MIGSVAGRQMRRHIFRWAINNRKWGASSSGSALGSKRSASAKRRGGLRSAGRRSRSTGPRRHANRGVVPNLHRRYNQGPDVDPHYRGASNALRGVRVGASYRLTSRLRIFGSIPASVLGRGVRRTVAAILIFLTVCYFVGLYSSKVHAGDDPACDGAVVHFVALRHARQSLARQFNRDMDSANHDAARARDETARANELAADPARTRAALLATDAALTRSIKLVQDDDAKVQQDNQRLQEVVAAFQRDIAALPGRCREVVVAASAADQAADPDVLIEQPDVVP